nr:hypothetical protein [uncultured Chitinophaga sp.]
MKIGFTQEISNEIVSIVRFVVNAEEKIEVFFESKSYGADLDDLIIRMVCVSPKFEAFFKPKRPTYREEAKVYVHKGLQVSSPAKYLSFDLRMQYDKYLNAAKPQPLFATDLMNSLDTISTVKKIKDFDLVAFKKDFAIIIEKIGWL